jgi:Alpha/beta hydrolase family
VTKGQTHYLPQPLPTKYSEPSVAYFSRLTTNVLVIFVHGFGGSAHGTWPNFPKLLSAMGEESRTFDIIFYQYDGKFTQANSSAALFRDFIDEFIAEPTHVVNSCLPDGAKRSNFSYTRIVLVAHSLGAVISRRALLDVYRRSNKSSKQRHWLKNITLLLFAPAHKGAYAAEIVRSTLGPSGWSLFGLFKAAIKYKTPLLADLSPGSTVLTSLENDTRQVLRAIGRSVPPFLVPKIVVWAEGDRVVINDPFVSDPVSIIEFGHDHLSVCKPRAMNESIFRHVANEL